VAIALVDSDAVGFADGSAGHVYTIPAGAPSVGDLDVLCINSNTTVSTPSGFTSRVSAVANQGAYIFTRKASGGEGSTVTITTSGDHNTTLTWSRWSGTDAYSAGSSAQANNANGTTLPAASTGTLASTGMLLVAFGALHNHDGALATAPSWSNSFSTLESVSQGASGASSSCVAFTAYKTNAGTASETINSVSWTNNVRNRYALWVAVTAAAGGSPIVVNVGQATETDTGAAIGRLKMRTLGQAAEVDTAMAVARLKLRTVGRATEVDTATAAGRLKARAVGLATEADTATVVGRRKARAVGQVVEVDAAQPVTVLGTIVVNVGQALESDTAQAVGRLKLRAVGRASELDVALAAGRVKMRMLGQAVEVDTAGAVAVSGGVPQEPLVPDVYVDLAVRAVAVDLAVPRREVML